MKRLTPVAALVPVICILPAVTVLAAGDATRGQAAYAANCSACHSLDYNGVGPAHRGVFGRKAGSQPDYAYSAAVKASGIVWDAQTLSRWLSDPEKLIPGQKMNFSVTSAKTRADIIAYLKSVPVETP